MAMDIDATTPSDYTLWIKGLPPDFKEAEVIEFFSNYGRRDGKPTEIVKCTRLHDINNFVKLSREANEYREMVALIDLCEK
jgi:RNA recognition motif-containing protein